MGVDADPSSTRTRAARPLFRLAWLLGSASVAGRLAAERLGLAPALAIAALVALCSTWRGRPAGGLVGATLLGFAAAASGAWGAPPATPDADRGPVLATRLEGRWRPVSGTTGWIEDPAWEGAPPLVSWGTGAPCEGTPVALLAGARRMPWPQGPVPGPRGARFAGLVLPHPDELVRGSPPPTTRLAAELARVRQAARDFLGGRLRSLHGDSVAAGLAAALLLGDRADLSRAVQDRFTRTGTRHMVAVSGLHVGLLAWVVILPLLRFSARCWPRPMPEGVLTGAAVLLFGAYAVLVGGPAVTRAAWALGLAQVARFVPGPAGTPPGLGRRPDGRTLWGAALLIELVRDPTALAQVGLALSYAATLGLLVGTRPLARRLLPAARPGPLPAGTVAGLRRRGLEMGVQGVAASMAAFLATLPIVAATFGEVALVGALATPLLVPLLGLLLATGWIGVLLPCAPVRLAFEALSGGLLEALSLLDHLPGTPWLLPERPAWLLALAVGLTFLAWQGTARLRGWIGGRGACLAWAVLLLPWCTSARGVELVVLDVGHGSAAFLRAPGLPGMFFDAGNRRPNDLWREALAPLLARYEVRRPEIVLSHAHGDHGSALESLLERFHPCAFHGALPPDLAPLLPATLVPLDVPRGSWRRPLAGGLGSLELHRGLERDGNEGSRSLRLRWRGKDLWLMGDAEEEGLEALLDSLDDRDPAPTRLLLFPHHGSETAHLDRLLTRLAPREVWISVGQAPPVAAELERRGLSWRATAQEGYLALELP